MEKTMTLSAIEATTYAKIAWGLIEKAADNSRDEFDDASKQYRDEVRARYVASEDGDADEYMAAAFQIFETEWNVTDNWPQAQATA